MRCMAIKTLPTHERFVRGYRVLQVLEIGVTGEAQIVAVTDQQMSKV